MSDCCDGSKTLIYACAGASDVGEITDKVARKLSGDIGQMTCLAAAGAHLSGFVESAKGAAANLVIDGCSVKCAAKLLEHIGVAPRAFVLTEMGLKKGFTPPDEKIVSDISVRIKKECVVSDKKQIASETKGRAEDGCKCSCGGDCR